MNETFNNKWKSHKNLEEGVYNLLEVYLKNKIKQWKMPNPSSTGPEFYLPANFNWKKEWREFVENYRLCFHGDKDPISWSSFYNYYTKHFDTLKKLNHKTDYCNFCCKIHVQLLNKNLSNEEIENKKMLLNEHLENARQAREAYNEFRRLAALQNQSIVLSFDFSENILLQNLQETPSIFDFKSRRKIEMFGVNNEGSNIQMNYLIDECFKIPKGPNCVISLLDHYIQNYVPIGVNLVLYADNSPAQNKNCTMISYLSYLVKVLKRHPQIDLYFLIAGHTKFGPDGHFGNIKTEIKRSICYSIKDLIGSEGLVQR